MSIFVFLKKKKTFGHFQNKNDAIELALLNDCVKRNLPPDRFFELTTLHKNFL